MTTIFSNPRTAPKRALNEINSYTPVLDEEQLIKIAKSIVITQKRQLKKVSTKRMNSSRKGYVLIRINRMEHTTDKCDFCWSIVRMFLFSVAIILGVIVLLMLVNGRNFKLSYFE